MVKIVEAIALVVIGLVHLSASLFGMNGRSADDIACIYVSHSGFGVTIAEHQIDLANQKLWEFHMGDDWSHPKKRNAAAKNEGFTFVKTLDSAKIKAFLQECKIAQFTSWQRFYEKPGIMDGDDWRIRIVYADNQEQIICGHNAYPLGWNRMYNALIQLTGENILILKSDWMRN